MGFERHPDHLFKGYLFIWCKNTAVYKTHCCHEGIMSAKSASTNTDSRHIFQFRFTVVHQNNDITSCCPEMGFKVWEFEITVSPSGDMERWLVIRANSQSQGIVLWGANSRAAQRWRSASCHPIAALRSRGGRSILGAWLVPRALKRSAPLSSQACTVRATPHHLTTGTTMSRPTWCPMTKRSTTRRRTSLRRRRNAVR